MTTILGKPTAMIMHMLCGISGWAESEQCTRYGKSVTKIDGLFFRVYFNFLIGSLDIVGKENACLKREIL